MTTPILVSIQAGLPAEHGADAISKRSGRSGIFKSKVDGRVFLGALNLVGDGQADLRVHSGEYRAVLAYGAAHYPVWRQQLGIPDFPYRQLYADLAPA
jgi:MOSC domain-containing protein YiiM